jgi:3',5'-cyclic-AMP phosphodiesterase
MLYQGVIDSNSMLVNAVTQLSGLNPQPDLVLLTGDLVDTGSPAEYEMLRALLAPLRMPFLVIPGNHDELDAFRQAFSDHAYIPASGPINYVVDDKGPLRIVAVDVTVPGLHHGSFDEEHERWLDNVLAAESPLPARPRWSARSQRRHHTRAD